jgi:propane monooxygenase small subunit
LFRSGFSMQSAASQNDFITPSVVSAAEGDYERNLANSVELFRMLMLDEAHADHNRGIFAGWVEKHGSLAMAAAHQLQPIWSQPRVKVANFTEALELAKNRLRAIGAETNIDVRSIVDA